MKDSFFSTVYIQETVRMIRLTSSDDKSRRKVLYELLAIKVTAIAMDLSRLTLEYLDYYFTQVIFKTTIYSIKCRSKLRGR